MLTPEVGIHAAGQRVAGQSLRGHTLSAVFAATARLTGCAIERAYAEK